MADSASDGTFAPLAMVQEVKEAREGELLRLPNVVGLGVGYKQVGGARTDELAVIVYVERKAASGSLGDAERAPGVLAVPTQARVVPRVPQEPLRTLSLPDIRVPTDVQEVGRVEAQTFVDRVRPVKPGYSISHFEVTAGTFGCLVRDVAPPHDIYILSNNHVLANSNVAAPGDAVFQPGPFDGGKVEDTVAHLSRFVPIFLDDPERYNLVDAALAKPLDMRLVTSSIVGLGTPRGTKEAALDMLVTKSGRTTQNTTGTVTGIDVTISVNYGAGVGYFRNQILTTAMSQGGDSGSLLLSPELEATGLLFAGSEEVTIHNSITDVLMALGVELITV